MKLKLSDLHVHSFVTKNHLVRAGAYAAVGAKGEVALEPMRLETPNTVMCCD